MSQQISSPVTPPPSSRSPEQIQADIASNQQRLAATVDELSERLDPQNLASGAADAVKSLFVRKDGSPKGKQIAVAGGALAALVVLRKIFHD